MSKDEDKPKSGNRDKAEGKAKQVKGKVQNAAGAITGNEKQQLKGKAKELEGKAQDKRGDIKKKLDK